ncbi:GGDEF domain-containing protein [Roseibium marinum]|uniref:Diguanylate cyclase (GGDEF)-like protein n=1 Tax=Roseibium marinum TaxID=281252 RepID=A0A2S3UNB0_9HYPH|nr:GGDEF domain-containing protein [Roseibium marinum]POF29202.1 diguanylate cyclase (GGDEF)-like protein [Roseibium marinum]
MQLSVLKNRLSKPSVIAVLLGAILFIALAGALHTLLDWQVRSSILKHAETKTAAWSTQFFGNIPNAQKVFAEGTLTQEEIRRLEKSFSMVDILHFEFFDEAGHRVLASNTGDPVPDDDSQNMALKVYRSGEPVFAIHHNEGGEQHGGADTVVEAFFPATLPTGERIGSVEVYVDVSELEDALEDSFEEISWILIFATTFILALPAAAYVIRTQQLRNRDMRLLELTKYDQLTGILNRNSISETLEQLLDVSATPQNVGILFVDVDFFKQVNDRFGHACGDRLLKHIADILQQSVRGSNDVVGRFGGDEFIVLCRDIDNADFQHLYGRLMERVKMPFRYQDQNYTPSLSVGAYLARAGDTQKTALHRADLAVYAAKRAGRSQVVEYSSDLEGLFKQEERRQTA